ncbi:MULTISPECIES: glycoside hydrolase family 19 protein [unclassified Pseudomonas]|uniref:glycoside hydrolase family 19 protein n=1 Tax=unclassified Pseudomonas TaxID=196821 RepID=UPI00128D1843|nr:MULTISPECIES: glycoside hydrolase family 19 protein [unclassified Pseudomonas]MPQ67121.1 glycoside hydrolase family 19 protein [Pseudomonas sp. MWU12-2323]
MPITQRQLLQILPNAGDQAGVFVPVLNTAMNAYQIVTTQRVAAFLAQAGHESGQLRSVVENLNYGAQALVATWPSRFTPDLAAQVARQPEQIANIVYASRMDNGDASSGDGWNYRGRGLIQITGRSNYRQCSLGLFGDERLLQQPELLEQPQWAAESAAWFWEQQGLNALADADQFNSITRKINGGLNGLEDRLQLWARARAVLCASST